MMQISSQWQYFVPNNAKLCTEPSPNVYETLFSKSGPRFRFVIPYFDQIEHPGPLSSLLDTLVIHFMNGIQTNFAILMPSKLTSFLHKAYRSGWRQENCITSPRRPYQLQ